MKLGKIIDGELVLVPHMIIVDGFRVHNPTEEQAKKVGYKEVIDTTQPEEPIPKGQHYESYYADKGEYILQEWKLVDNIVLPPTIDERVSSLEDNSTMLTECVLELSEQVYK